MRALKINFGGPNKVSIDWNAQVEGMVAVAQRAGVAIMTRRGSDKFLPERGTDVARALFSYGAFDLLSMQHVLNFGALKARADMQDYEGRDLAPEAQVRYVQMTLVSVKDNAANVSVVVANQAGQTTRTITQLT